MNNLILMAALACNLAALTPAERKEHVALTRKLFAAVISRQETTYGYAFRLDRDRITLAQVREWIAKESRCCPFIHFAVEEKPLVLRLGGGKDVKAFIASEFQGGP